MTHKELEQARNALIEFMSAMNRWENDFYRAKQTALKENRDIALVDNEWRKELTAILVKWAFPEKSNQGRLIDLGCTDPPTYDPDSDVEESVEATDDSVAFIIYQTKGLQSKFRITLKQQSGKWKIKKKELLNYKDKWQRSVL
ncbi:GspH/FimT family pseudopilin [Paraburkholderia sp. MPAMCS5]|uniref:GspH/FimT family pseudopilin n=1 Tax=Paraburkholderia sp. MPAMCS5 TaxID=3112563 RepID=UPI002E19E746|nr:GspH/FimT family pseudopilin [Paraburkholderia sp. MPAMCS5]